MPLLTITYCTLADVERLLSMDGVEAFADHDGNSVPDVDVVEDCINQATEEMDAYLMQRYDQTQLATSTLANRWCTTVSAYFLCTRRGNPPPDSLQLEFDRIMDPDRGMLVRCRRGEYQLPRIPLRADLRPSWSNLRVDRRWPNSKVRVTRSNSNDAATKLTQDLHTDQPIIDG